MAQFETIPIDAVEVGERRREEMGDLEALAKSIDRYGLIHPIVVDEANRLVAGGRRLAVCKTLGWTEVPVRRYADLRGTEREEIELEENLRRKDLTPYEQSRGLVRKAEVIAPIISTKLVEKDTRGRKSDYGVPKSEVAAAIGEKTTNLVQAEHHVATAEAYPFMQNADWRQSQVLEAKEHIERISDEHKPVVAAIISEPGVPPRTAVSILANAAEMETPALDEVKRLYDSPDPRDKSLAKTKLAQIEPRADPRSLIVARCIRDIERCSEMDRESPLVEGFRDLVCRMAELRQEILKEHRRRIDG